MAVRKCLICGKEFEVAKRREKTAKFCSMDCYTEHKKTLTGAKNNHYSPRVSKNCLVCGKEFKVIPSKSQNAKYCSKRCQTEACKKIKGENHPLYKPKVKCKCKICGKLFHVKESAVKRGKKFCSQGCYSEYKRTITDNKHPRFSKIKIKCVVCGKEFFTQPYRIKEGIKVCSRTCLTHYLARLPLKRETNIEKLVAQSLDSFSVKYEKQKPIQTWIVDFYLPQYNAIIEADGDYWHSLPKVKERDRRKNRDLSKLGYKVIRLKGGDIENDPAGEVWKALSAL